MYGVNTFTVSHPSCSPSWFQAPSTSVWMMPCMGGLILVQQHPLLSLAHPFFIMDATWVRPPESPGRPYDSAHLLFSSHSLSSPSCRAGWSALRAAQDPSHPLFFTHTHTHTLTHSPLLSLTFQVGDDVESIIYKLLQVCMYVCVRARDCVCNACVCICAGLACVTHLCLTGRLPKPL